VASCAAQRAAPLGRHVDPQLGVVMCARDGQVKRIVLHMDRDRSFADLGLEE
jgi:hypothetical protein